MKYVKRGEARRACLHNEGQAAVVAIENLESIDVIQCRDCRFFSSHHNDTSRNCIVTLRSRFQWDFCSRGVQNGVEVRGDV